VSRVQLAPGALDDLDRILEHLERHEVDAREVRVSQIISALDVLGDSPLIGRPAGHGLRELVIGRDARGYVALYRYLEPLGTALVLAIRSQREAGYASPE